MSRVGEGRAVSSRQNSAVKQARALERDRSLRKRARTYVAWGLHLAREALRTGAPLRQAFVGPAIGATPEGSNLLRGLQEVGVPILRTTTEILDWIAEGSGDQGVLLLCVRADCDPSRILKVSAPIVVATHGVQDPGNLGSILRSATALGASGLIVLPGCTDPFGSRSVRAAMGAQFSLPVAEAAEDVFLALTQAARLQLVAADPRGQRTPAQIDLTAPTVLLLGGEGGGLPGSLLRAAQHRVRIPMARGSESLNVHAAAAVLLYEAGRQRAFEHDWE